MGELAVDVDEQALDVAKLNASKNGMLAKMEFIQHDILLPPPAEFPVNPNSADMTFANLSREVFAGGVSHIAELTQHGGFIVATGFLESDSSELMKFIDERENSLLLREVRSINDWVALVYERTVT